MSGPEYQTNQGLGNQQDQLGYQKLAYQQAVREVLSITKTFSNSRQSRTPAMERLGQQISTSSEPAIRARSADSNIKPSGKYIQEEERKGEPTNSSEPTQPDSRQINKILPTSGTNQDQEDCSRQINKTPPPSGTDKHGRTWRNGRLDNKQPVLGRGRPPEESSSSGNNQRTSRHVSK